MSLAIAALAAGFGAVGLVYGGLVLLGRAIDRATDGGAV